MKQNNFLDALELALSFYEGTAMAVIGTFTNSLMIHRGDTKEVNV